MLQQSQQQQQQQQMMWVFLAVRLTLNDNKLIMLHSFWNRMSGRSMDGSPPVFEQIFRNARFAQGGNAFFEGKVRGNPQPQLSWTREGRPLSGNDRHLQTPPCVEAATCCHWLRLLTQRVPNTKWNTSRRPAKYRCSSRASDPAMKESIPVRLSISLARPFAPSTFNRKVGARDGSSAKC